MPFVEKLLFSTPHIGPNVYIPNFSINENGFALSGNLENTKEKVERFNGEVNYFAKKWEKELKAGDLYYNKNLTLEKHDFSLKIL